MAYEDMTYEVILQRMIDRVVDKNPDVDVREGSIVFNALAPAAFELATAYITLDNILYEMSVSTASRGWLLVGCKDMGMDISAFAATKGTHKGAFNVEVPIGSRWNHDEYNYAVTEYIGLEDELHTYKLQCETEGSAPNVLTGDLTPITDAPVELTAATLLECLIEGEDETSDENIRKAYYEYVNATISDGNIAQYQRWCNEYDGIGKSKVFPLWNGANTVKVSILTASGHAASDELIDEFQTYLDPGVTGMGDGVAPIGAFVTVTTATEVPITVSASITLKSGYSDTSAIDTAISNYFSEISYEKRQIAYMNVGAVILGVDGVESITDLTINGGNVDIQLGEEEIPALTDTNWTVI